MHASPPLPHSLSDVPATHVSPLQQPLRQLVELHPPPESPVLPLLLASPPLLPPLLPPLEPPLLPLLASPLVPDSPSSAASAEPPPSWPVLSLVPVPLVAHAPMVADETRTRAPHAHADECFMCEYSPSSAPPSGRYPHLDRLETQRFSRGPISANIAIEGTSGMETETLIVGAGPAGLATGACLRRAGREFVIVDGASAVSSWRRHYERLHLHTARSHSSLPHHSMPSDWPTYVPRARFVEYLEDYARTFGLVPRFGERVTRAEPLDGQGWRVTTSAGEHEVRHLVVASGNTAVPHRPAFPGQLRFGGEIAHSSDYRNADPYRGKRVLVVGAGNTGGEVALELSEKGATSVDLCIRGKLHVITRDALGLPTQVMAALTLWIPLPLRDVIFRALMRVLVGNLSRWGIHAPAEGILAQIVRVGRVPLIDVGTIGAIRAGRIQVRPDIKELTEIGARFVDGKEGAYDVIVLATGFRPKLDAFLERATDVLDERGYPRRRGCETELPGLYFVGFDPGQAGQLRQIAIEARRVAADIARRPS